MDNRVSGPNEIYNKTGESTLIQGELEVEDEEFCELDNECEYEECEVEDEVETVYESEDVLVEIDWTTFTAPGGASGSPFRYDIEERERKDSHEYESYSEDVDPPPVGYYEGKNCEDEVIEEGEKEWYPTKYDWSEVEKVTDDDRESIDPELYIERIDVGFSVQSVNTGFASDIESNVDSEVRDIEEGYTVGGGSSGKRMGNSESEAFTSYNAILGDYDADEFEYERIYVDPDYDEVLNPSGPDGQSSGIIAIRDFSGESPWIVGSTPGFLEHETRDGESADYVTSSMIDVPGCDGSGRCIVEVEPYVWNRDIKFSIG